MLLDVQETTLANGIKIVSANIPGVESVSIGIWVGIGSRHETERLSGISHFIEHLLFKGSDKMSALDISRAIEGCGGYVNAFTQEEMTCYYARVAYNHAWKVLNILCDIVLYPRFNELDIEKERNIIIEEIMMYRDNPENVVQELLNSIIWKNHQLGRPLTGSPESLVRIGRRELTGFKENKYVARNTVLAFAGKVRHGDAVARVEKIMACYPASHKPRLNPVARNVRQDSMILKTKEIEQSQLAVGFRTFGMFDRRRYVLKMLSVILGENMSSRLFQVVREKHGLAYSVHSGVQLFSDTGCFVISAGLDRERRRKALELIIKEVRKLKNDAVKPKELARAREYLVGHIRLSLEGPSGQMMWIGSNMLNYGRYIDAEEIIDAVYDIKSDDIQTLAGKVFRPRAASLALLSPGLAKREEDHVRALMDML